MAILKIKHNSQLFADLSAATSGVVAAMENAQVGEFWAGDYGTGAVLAFKGVNGVSVFSDATALTAEFKASLQNYYTKEEIDTLFNTKLSKYYTKDELDAALDSIVNSAISVVGGDGIIINGDGTEKTISTNVELEIKTVEGKEMIQLLDGTDQTKVLAEVDASKFVVDGMLDSASIVTINDETELPEGVELPNGKYIKLTWNTDAGKSDTYVAVADLISEHKVVAGEDVAGEMVIVATNVVESTDENGIKVSTVNVTVDDSAVKTALDSKIGKEDVMIGGEEKTITETFSKETSLFGGDVWEVTLQTGGSYTGPGVRLLDEYNNTIMDVSHQYGGQFKFSLQDGLLTGAVYADGAGSWLTQTVDAVVGVEKYKLLLSYDKEGATATITTTSFNKNTSESISYLNEKTSNVSAILANDKIGKTDNMVYVENAIIDESYVLNQKNTSIDVYNDVYWKIECVAESGYPSYELTNNRGEVIYSLYGEGPYVNKLTLIHNNGELEIITYSGEGEMSTSKKTITSYLTYTLKLTSNHSSKITVSTPKTGYLNVKETLNYLNKEKIDVSDLEPVNITLEGKIGHEDTMLSFTTLTEEFTEELIGNGESEVSSNLFAGGSYWVLDVTLNNYGLLTLCNTNGGEVVYNYNADGPMEKHITFTCNNGILTIDYGFQPEQKEINVYGEYHIKLQSNSIANIKLSYYNSSNYTTKTSIEYLNEQIQNNTSNKLGKFDTVLSVNDGESNTEYNVEGALDYLNSEIQALNIINCGVY